MPNANSHDATPTPAYLRSIAEVQAPSLGVTVTTKQVRQQLQPKPQQSEKEH